MLSVEYLETQVTEHTFLRQSGRFITRRDYPKFVIQEMTVNAICHRAYNIKGTEIQIKMFDDRMVFETPGRLPSLVKPSNIRTTHFSRNPKIAAFLKAYHYVKEFGEGVDRMSRELEANGTSPLQFHLDDFILKITMPRFLELAEKVTENAGANATVNATANVTVKNQSMLEKLTEQASSNGKKLSKKQTAILTLMIDNPYITKKELANSIGIQETTVMRNIEAMRGKLLRRVGSDKNGFWEMIVEKRTENGTDTTQITTQKTTLKAKQKTTQKIIEQIKADGRVSRMKLAEICGISPDGIKWQLKKLQKQGIIRRVGPDKGGFWEIIE